MAVNRQDLGAALREGMAKTAETQVLEGQQAKEEIPKVVDTDGEDTEPKPLIDGEIPEGEEVDGEDIKDDDEVDGEEDTEVTEVEVGDDISVTSLAEAMGVEPEFLYNMKVSMPDGQEPMTLSELKDAVTKGRHESDDAVKSLEQERADFEAYREQEAQKLQATMQLPQEIMAAQAKAMAIAHQYQSFDWESLEKDNPGQAALEKQNMASAYQAALSEANELTLKHQQRMTTELQEFQRKEYQNMIKVIPDWKNDELRVQEQSQMRPMLKAYGYSDRDINMLADHRAMKIARDLWKFKVESEKAVKTVKRVIKVPKVLKPGGGSKTVVKAKKVAQGIQQAKEVKGDRNKAAAIAGLMRG